PAHNGAPIHALSIFPINRPTPDRRDLHREIATITPSDQFLRYPRFDLSQTPPLPQSTSALSPPVAHRFPGPGKKLAMRSAGAGQCKRCETEFLFGAHMRRHRITPLLYRES